MHAVHEPDVVLLPVRTTTAPFEDAEVGALVAMLKTLAGPIRVRLLEALALQELSVGELTERIGTDYAAVSQSLARLRAAGLVTVRRDGNRTLYRTTNPHLPSLLATLLHLATHPAPPEPGNPHEHH
ncbi:ArsR/SmtB family transcription factor [Streptomyces sp. GS7]|uniref:ArsR/SmtB family transcription factor n=1 Tax=Streptomyces sp. GS7 TaxID=2692234 RepID=UPI001316F603|nr:metalloregulator ArsR/SmtB family transcription factor [Streptomyces sp. GS7]QHC26415.1 metalloregulator ArsR/SmtB family transcription factor [Streptomyces sp. GS7]